MSKDSLGDRMKGYEDLYRIKLMKRVPIIIRIDGKAFHTYLKDAKKPFDVRVTYAMCQAAQAIIREIGGTARLAYTQSDECSVVINNALDINTSAWFDNNLQKMVSVAASVFTTRFNKIYGKLGNNLEYANFDARAFVLPDLSELVNYLVWRQQDATRNSIRMYASTMFSHKELDGVSNDKVQEMMFQKSGFNWNDAPTWTKRGIVMTKDTFLEMAGPPEIPIFTQNRTYIEKLYLPDDTNRTMVEELPKSCEPTY